jgi:hypothetical protein
MNYDPNKVHIIEDNIEAMRLIVDKGFLDLLVPKPGQQFAAHCYESEHHWCCASFHCGHAEKKDNGYAVAMIPKSTHTKQEASEGFAECIQETTVGITYEHRPYGNREHN